MSFEVFVNKVMALIERAGGDIDVTFEAPDESGKFSAVFEDGTVITGNRICKSVTVMWNGKNHMAMAEI